MKINIIKSAVIFSLVLASFGLNTKVPVTAATQNYVQIENSKPGTTDWRLTNPGYASGVIEGYASLTSVNRGGQIKFFVNTADPTYTLEIFRMGYYQGLGGRRMTNPVTLTGTKQAIPTPDPVTGLIECYWINPYILNIPNTSDPTDWMSGFYYVKLTGSSGKQQYITFAVRDDQRASDLILVEAVTTSQAYNVWGGKSVYGTINDRGNTALASRKTSFDRPYYGDETFGAGNFSIQNEFKYYEWGTVQFLEANGYDVTYATNIDVDTNPNLLLNHKAFLSVGHDEYWSTKMRDNVEHARDAGVNLGFFSANTAYWQVHFENSVANNQPGRVMVAYKDYCTQDPITPANLKSCRFRETKVEPINRPEDEMMGVLFVTQGRMPFVVDDASNWVLTGTGLKNGDKLLAPDGSFPLGYEVDAMGTKSPANVHRMGHSPATSENANYSDMVEYRAPSGATVFSTGTIFWNLNVPQFVQITKNVLARFITNSFTEAEPVRDPLPAGYQAVDIGDVGRPGYVSLPQADKFTLNGGGQDSFGGSDTLYYLYKQMTGDMTVTARLNGVQEYWDNRGGLMIRESLAGNGKYVSLLSRPSGSRMNGSSGLNEGAEFKVKDVVGANARKLAQVDLPMPNWLKLSRTGNVFDAYTSADGITWSLLGSTTVPLNANLYVGAAAASSRHGVWVTTIFDNYSAVPGGFVPTDPVPDTIPPVVTVTAPTNNSIVLGTVSLTASASDNSGVVAGVQWKIDGTNFGSEITSGNYSSTWDSRLVADGPHTITAQARDRAGNLGTSTVNVTVRNTAPPSTLPSGWAHRDIGAVGPAGNASYDSSSTTFTVTGAGADIWNNADAFHYAYTQLTGDGAIVARVATVSAGQAWVKAGVMIRETLDPASTQAYMLVSYTKGSAFQRRVATGGVSTSTAGGAAITAPYWVKIERAGNIFTASQSANGTIWTVVGTDTIPMGAQVYIGLAVSSHTNTATATGTFNNVSITTTAPPPPDTTAPTVQITAPANNSTVSGNVTVTANAADNVGVTGVQFKIDGVNFGAEKTTSPYATSWNTASANNGTHTITATARDAAGNSASST